VNAGDRLARPPVYDDAREALPPGMKLHKLLAGNVFAPVVADAFTPVWCRRGTLEAFAQAVSRMPAEKKRGAVFFGPIHRLSRIERERPRAGELARTARLECSHNFQRYALLSFLVYSVDVELRWPLTASGGGMILGLRVYTKMI
jgi:hypothetical protein